MLAANRDAGLSFKDGVQVWETMDRLTAQALILPLEHEHDAMRQADLVLPRLEAAFEDTTGDLQTAIGWAIVVICNQSAQIAASTDNVLRNRGSISDIATFYARSDKFAGAINV
jgi:hypothetical protein